jgi:hypothetical protein
LASLIATLRPETDRLATLYRNAIAEQIRRRAVVDSRYTWHQDNQARLSPTTTRANWCSRCAPMIAILADALEQIARQLRDVDDSSCDHVI